MNRLLTGTKQTLKRSLLFVGCFFLKVLGPARAIRLLLRVLRAVCQQTSPQQALRHLFYLDSQLYVSQGELAVAYDDGFHVKHRLTRYHDFFVRRIATGSRVLDIGCGVGIVAHSIASACNVQVTGIDFDAEKVRRAERMYLRTKLAFVHGDALCDLPKERYDVIVLSNVLEHLEARSDFLQTLQQQLHPEIILIRVPLFERDWRVPLKRELEVEWRLDPTHFIECTHETFCAEIEAAGLSVSHLESRWGEIWAEVKVAA